MDEKINVLNDDDLKKNQNGDLFSVRNPQEQSGQNTSRSVLFSKYFSSPAEENVFENLNLDHKGKREKKRSGLLQGPIPRVPDLLPSRSLLTHHQQSAFKVFNKPTPSTESYAAIMQEQETFCERELIPEETPSESDPDFERGKSPLEQMLSLTPQNQEPTLHSHDSYFGPTKNRKNSVGTEPLAYENWHFSFKNDSVSLAKSREQRSASLSSLDSLRQPSKLSSKPLFWEEAHARSVTPRFETAQSLPQLTALHPPHVPPVQHIPPEDFEVDEVWREPSKEVIDLDEACTPDEDIDDGKDDFAMLCLDPDEVVRRDASSTSLNLETSNLFNQDPSEKLPAERRKSLTTKSEVNEKEPAHRRLCSADSLWEKQANAVQPATPGVAAFKLLDKELPSDPLTLMGPVSRKGLALLQAQVPLSRASPALLAHFLKTCKGEVDAASAMCLSIAEEYRDLVKTYRRILMKGQQDVFRSSLDLPDDLVKEIMSSPDDELPAVLKPQFSTEAETEKQLIEQEPSPHSEYRCPEFPLFEPDPVHVTAGTAEYEVVLDAEKLGMTVENVLERTIVRTVGSESAAGKAGVLAGSLLVGLAGRSTAALSHHEILEGLRHAKRPLHLRFRRLSMQRLQIRRAEMRGLIHPHDWLGGLGSESALAGSADGRVTDVMVAFVEERMLALLRLLAVGQEIAEAETEDLDKVREGAENVLTGSGEPEVLPVPISLREARGRRSVELGFKGEAHLSGAGAASCSDAKTTSVPRIETASNNIVPARRPDHQVLPETKNSPRAPTNNKGKPPGNHKQSIAFLVVLAEFYRSLERHRKSGFPIERVAAMCHAIAQLSEVFDWNSEVVHVITQDLRDLLCLLLDVNGDTDAEKEDEFMQYNIPGIEMCSVSTSGTSNTETQRSSRGAVSMMLQQLILHLSQEQLELQIIPLVHRISVSSVSSRLACVSLLPLVIGKLPLPKQLQLRGVLTRFIRDVAPAVRRCAAMSLTKVALATGQSAISWLMLLCEYACSDSDETVRKAALDTCIGFLVFLPHRLKLNTQNDSLSLVCEVSPAPSPHVGFDTRLTDLDSFFPDCNGDKSSKLSDCSSKGGTPKHSDALEALVSCLNREEHTMKHKMFSLITNLIEDPSWQVRAFLAWRSDVLCSCLGVEWAAVVVDLLQTLLQDHEGGVKIEALKAMPRLSRLLLDYAVVPPPQQTPTSASFIRYPSPSVSRCSMGHEIVTGESGRVCNPRSLRAPSASASTFPLKHKSPRDLKYSTSSVSSEERERSSSTPSGAGKKHWQSKLAFPIEEEDTTESQLQAHTKILDVLVPTATLATEATIDVCYVLTSSLGDLLWILDAGGSDLPAVQKKISDNVLPAVLSLLQHPNSQICCGMLNGLECAAVSSPNEADGRYKRIFTDHQLHEIITVLLDLTKARDWRVREASARTLPSLVAASCGPHQRRQLGTLCLRLLGDCVDRVRTTIAHAISQAAQVDIIQRRWIESADLETASSDGSEYLDDIIQRKMKRSDQETVAGNIGIDLEQTEENISSSEITWNFQPHKNEEIPSLEPKNTTSMQCNGNEQLDSDCDSQVPVISFGHEGAVSLAIHPGVNAIASVKQETDAQSESELSHGSAESSLEYWPYEEQQPGGGWGSWLSAYVFPVMRICCDSKNFQKRLLCTMMAQVLVQLDVITIVQLQLEILPMFKKISEDAIPNVRITLARVVGSLALGMADEEFRDHLHQIIKDLVEDHDPDVKYFAREAQERIRNNTQVSQNESMK